MKNKLKKSSNPDPRTARPAKEIRLHILRLTGFALGLSVMLTLFALLAVGLPPGLTHRITAQIQASGIPLQIESIHLSTHRGWVLKNVRLYSTSPDDLHPLLSAKKLYVLLWPINWKKPSEDGWHIKLYVKNLGISLGQPWESTLPEDHPFRTISRLSASLIVAPEHVEIETADLYWSGINIHARGATQFSKSNGSWIRQSRDFRQQAVKAADTLSRLKCARPPQLNLDFNFNETQPEKTFLAVDLSAEGITWQDYVYKQLSGTLGYHDYTWTLPSLRLNQSDSEQLVLHSTINLNNSNAQVSVENTLPAADLFNLLPEKMQADVARTGVKPYGRLNFTASAGPAPFDRLTEKVDVLVEQAQLKRQDITLDPLAFHLTRDGNRVEMKGIQAQINGGPLAGSFELNLDSKAWTARAQTQCDPVFAGAYDEDLQEFLLRFNFPDEQPKADLTISSSGPDASIVMVGTLSGNRFTCGGVPIGHLETSMVFSNRVLDLVPIHAVRAKEQFDGSVQVDFNRQLAFFNATNSFPPTDIARALAPEEHTILEDFRFDGPVYAVGRGQIDYGTWTNHLFKGTFRAENVGMNKLQASLFNTDIDAHDTQLLFTNAAAQFYGGFAEGSAEFDVLLEDGTAPYRINARITQIDLAQMLKQISSNNYGGARGQLSATLNLTADAATGFWQSVQGGGRVEIKDGHLADVPFFGGFSRLIQSTFAGFSLFSLTTFSADYELHDNAIWSENAQLGGTLVSARGRGSYSPESGLNFVVAAEPLRQTRDNKEWYQIHLWAADVLKEGTAPFLRLLEFQLSGPLDKPEWRFVNLPKEISDILHLSK
ncbi:MAG: AsmA-like C-terminal region-containing protein [Kiritimatiellales bacterium]